MFFNTKNGENWIHFTSNDLKIVKKYNPNDNKRVVRCEPKQWVVTKVKHIDNSVTKLYMHTENRYEDTKTIF